MNPDGLRSFLIVKGDDEAALAAARASKADALILDAADLVAPENRDRARGLIGEFLREKQAQSIWLRIPPAARYHDLALLQPDGFLLPGIDEHDALYGPDAMIGLAEKEAGLAADTIKLMVSAGDDAEAVLNLDTYHYPPLPRLKALTWDADLLALGIGAAAVREGDAFSPLLQAVRCMVLMAAKSAALAAVESGFTDLSDGQGLAKAASRARRDGFTAMVALHADQIETINAAFTPSAEEIAAAKALLAQFAANFGDFWHNGKSYDRRHLKMAQRVVALAKRLNGAS